MNNIKLKEYPYVIKHLGVGGCGGDACYIDHMPKSGSFIRSKDLLHIDGSPVKLNSVRVCDNCGKAIAFKTVEIFKRQAELEHYFLTRGF